MEEDQEAEKKPEVDETIWASYRLKPIHLRNFVGYFILSVLVVLSIFSLMLVLTIFPSDVPVSHANDLLNVMISTDGILLGLVGIIFAQLLSSIGNRQNSIYLRMLEKPRKASEYIKSLEFLDARRGGLSLIAAVTFGSLLVSIFLSMASIAKNSNLLPTDTYATYGMLFGPFLFTNIAIILLVTALIFPLMPRIEKNGSAE